MGLDPQDLLSIALAMVVGGAIGIERELRDKAAGFRTTIFICMGATLFTILSDRLSGSFEPTRISANIVVGVGFLGAGVILRQAGRVTGLTTAALIWFTAALGMGLGGRQYALVGVVTVLGLVILGLFPRLERWLDGFYHEKDYEMVYAPGAGSLRDLESRFREAGLNVVTQRFVRADGELRLTWRAAGRRASHHAVQEALSTDPGIRELRV